MKEVYAFEEVKKEMKDLVGNKGAQLGEMSSIGIPVPPGFVITTRACVNYLKSKKIPDSLKKEILSALKELEKKTKRKFGSTQSSISGLMMRQLRDLQSRQKMSGLLMIHTAVSSRCSEA